MFGHQDQTTTNNGQDAVAASVDAMLTDSSAPTQPAPIGSPTSPAVGPNDVSAAVSSPVAATTSIAQAPSAPAANPPTAPSLGSEDDTPADNSGGDIADDTATADSSSTDEADPTKDLLGIKQNALQQLWPLVDHLDQTPEEKFRTTIMMIQGTDDQSLIKTAYEAAQKITDEKARAEALLDVVNEINYFTHKQTAADN